MINVFCVQLERRDVVASQTLRAALSNVEAVHPGFTYDFVVGILRQGDLNVNMNESMLRLQGAVTETDGNFEKVTTFVVILCRNNIYMQYNIFS